MKHKRLTCSEQECYGPTYVCLSQPKSNGVSKLYKTYGNAHGPHVLIWSYFQEFSKYDIEMQLQGVRQKIAELQQKELDLVKKLVCVLKKFIYRINNKKSPEQTPFLTAIKIFCTTSRFAYIRDALTRFVVRVSQIISEFSFRHQNS